MSRAERRIPAPPSIGGALRAAATDFYYNSWRFVGANLIFGLGLLAVAFLTLGAPAWGVAIALTAPLAAGITRMAAYQVRERHTDFGEFTAELRRPWRSLALGSAQVLLAMVLFVDIGLGAGLGNFVGALLAVSALYGLVLLWLFALAAWPLVLDPERAAEPLSRRLRLAGVLLVMMPIRMLVLGFLLGVLALVSTLAVAPMMMLTMAFISLAAAHYVLTAADRLEGRATVEPEE